MGTLVTYRGRPFGVCNVSVGANHIRIPVLTSQSVPFGEQTLTTRASHRDLTFDVERVHLRLPVRDNEDRFIDYQITTDRDVQHRRVILYFSYNAIRVRQMRHAHVLLGFQLLDCADQYLGRGMDDVIMQEATYVDFDALDNDRSLRGARDNPGQLQATLRDHAENLVRHVEDLPISISDRERALNRNIRDTLARHYPAPTERTPTTPPATPPPTTPPAAAPEPTRVARSRGTRAIDLD